MGDREPIESVPEIPIWLSLTVILGSSSVATVASLLKTRGEQADDAPAVAARRHPGRRTCPASRSAGRGQHRQPAAAPADGQRRS